MALTETIIWTAVPNGIATGPTGGAVLRLSVHVAPNLGGGSGLSLDQFPDFVHWPANVTTISSAPLEFVVTIVDAANHPHVARASIDTSVLRPDIWDALFSPAAGIEVSARDAGEPYTSLPVISFPMGKVADWLKSQYADWAHNTPTDFPAHQDLISPAQIGEIGHVKPHPTVTSVPPPTGESLADILKDLQDERQSIAKNTGKPKRANDFTTASTAQTFAALRQYHQPRGGGGPHGGAVGQYPAKILTPPALPTVDFHRALTFIGEHRALQRALGLVFDLEVTIAPPNGTVTVSVTPNFPGSGAAASGPAYTAVTPVTTAVLGATTFEAMPKTAKAIAGRQLKLGDPTVFEVHQVDADGGGLKVALFADNVKMSQYPQGPDAGGPAPDAPTNLAPPSLRSGGVTVTAVNRGLNFVGTLDRSEALMKGLPAAPVLFADDLVRGYVLDVHDTTHGGWNSTAMRTGSYAVDGLPPLTTSDEASIDAPPRIPAGPSDPQQLNLPENLVRWDGWSMAGPRPGKPIQDDGTTVESIDDGGPFSQLQMNLAPTPHSLPRLRFGERYQLRMRVVDIAGNVIALADGAATGDPQQRVSPEALYGRHEPIGSPDIYRHEPPVPGESLKRLVIRSEGGPGGPESVETSLRTLAPPRSSQLFAEHHGMFDVNSGGVTLDKTAYPMIIARESASYPDAAISSTEPVPYLPDPLSRGGTLTITTGPLTGGAIPFEFMPDLGKAWPDYRPYHLTLVPGGALPSVDAVLRVVTYPLTMADVVTVRLSSHLMAGDEKLLGIYDWVTQKYNADLSPGGYRDKTVAGQHWAMTPFVELELVYAVRLPLATPEFAELDVVRDVAWTYANLSGRMSISRKSTSSIDVLAQWHDPIDDGPGTPAPSGPGAPTDTRRDYDTPVFKIAIPATGLDLSATATEFGGRHEFHDTRHHEVTYRATATSRFTEFFAETTSLASPSANVVIAISASGFEPGSPLKVTRTIGDTVTTYAEGTDFTVDRTAGTITFSVAIAGAVDVTFLRPAVLGSVTPVTRSVPSSARPASVQIRDVVPIYDWSGSAISGRALEPADGATIAKSLKPPASARSPSALRVFIERPWWSSGIGELVGVVTSQKAETPNAKAQLQPPESLYVSDWGADPVFDGPVLPTPHPGMAAFTQAVAQGVGLPIDENAMLVNVAGHAVAYDAERQLWYCDVHVNTGKAYTPMIRLALARYQPTSVPGTELSRIVLADIMSLEPGRTVTITRSSHNTLATVALSGYSYTKVATLKGAAPGVAQLTIEVRDDTVVDEVLGWRTVGKPIAMNAETHAGLTTWTARNVHLPATGKARLFIEQFEVVPTEVRTGVYIGRGGSKPAALRLLYQDLVPIG